MNIAIHLANYLIAEAIRQFLVNNGYPNVVLSNWSSENGFEPHVLLVDVTTIRHAIVAQHPKAKVLLIDTGIQPERLFTTLLSHSVHGVVSANAGLQRFKRVLTAVSQGKIWIGNGPVEALLQETGAISKRGRIGRITNKERVIVDYICQGLSNKEIAESLRLSEHTVKTHVHNIFRKLNISSRSRLMTLAVNRLDEASA